MEFQTRSEVNGLSFHTTFEKAIDASEEDSSIWKISFSLPTGERIRLVKRDTSWVVESLESEITKLMLAEL